MTSVLCCGWLTGLRCPQGWRLMPGCLTRSAPCTAPVTGMHTAVRQSLQDTGPGTAMVDDCRPGAIHYRMNTVYAHVMNISCPRGTNAKGQVGSPPCMLPTLSKPHVFLLQAACGILLHILLLAAFQLQHATIHSSVFHSALPSSTSTHAR